MARRRSLVLLLCTLTPGASAAARHCHLPAVAKVLSAASPLTGKGVAAFTAAHDLLVVGGGWWWARGAAAVCVSCMRTWGRKGGHR